MKMKILYFQNRKKTVDGVRKKTMTFYKTNITENYTKPIRVNIVFGGPNNPRKPKIKKQLIDKIIKAMEHRKIRNVKNPFEQEETGNSRHFFQQQSYWT